MTFESDPAFVGMNFSRAEAHPEYYESPFVNGAWEGWQARAALATQPAAGEPVAWAIPGQLEQAAKSGRTHAVQPRQTDAWTQPLFAAPPAAAPVAAGEPVAFDGKTVADRLDQMADAQLPGSSAQSDLYAAATVWRKHLAPPAAAHGDEAVRKDAGRYQALRNTPEIFIGVAEGDDMVFLKSPDQLDQLADNAAAMRAQGDRGGS